MLILKPPDIPSREITPEALYISRRRFIQTGAVLGAGLALGAAGWSRTVRAAQKGLGKITPGTPVAGETLTPYVHATSYNNFYELGTDKEDPAKNAGRLVTDPWSIVVDGEVAKPGRLAMEDILKFPLEERIYRLRCVETWSMVIPWAGFSLGSLLKKFHPTSKARYVAFSTLYDPKRLPEQRLPILDWPYREGLRMDEAMHPLTLLAVGLYGKPLPPQNGAPIRLVVPWKYGFKSIKSIVRITLTEKQPPTAWNMKAADEYGFYANVNPNVSHPRWSQARERRLGEFLKRETLMFNGYGDQVASMYQGMDLSREY